MMKPQICLCSFTVEINGSEAAVKTREKEEEESMYLQQGLNTSVGPAIFKDYGYLQLHSFQNV